MDLNKKTFTTDIHGTEFKLETSILAGQANASIIGTYGDTVVLATATMANTDRKGVGYFPLSVIYEERFYAVGKILGSRFMRREGRPSKDATLNRRLIDRSMRPLFDHAIRRDIQVVMTILSVDGEHDPKLVGLMAASAALAISDIPWNGPIAGVHISKTHDGEIIINPTNEQRESAFANMFFTGTKDRINMIEVEAHEVQEDDVTEFAKQAQEVIQKLVEFQKSIIKEIGHEKTEIPLHKPSEKLEQAVRSFVKGKLEETVYTTDKKEAHKKLSELKESLTEHLHGESFLEEDIALLDDLLYALTDELIHDNVLQKERRPDGRKLNEVRELYAGVGLFKRTHGTGLFIRGDTQVLSVTTLGAPGQEQLIETMETTDKERFIHHYNFPPYSVGETGFFRGAGWREIGHGALAEKALRPLLPSKEDFPYTLRVVAETLSSNGSSSMATVCAGSLSLMDAGVPIASPAAGIAMGLIIGKDGEYKVLTDIQGPEDHFGDMDLKVAGTRNGITAIQMDVKIDGITSAMLHEALQEAKKARLHILDTTNKVLGAPREDLSPYAPRVYVIHIDPDKIRNVIGPGGKIINEIIDKTETSIDIEQDGSVYVTGSNAEMTDKAIQWIKDITRVYQVGEVVEGEIIKLMDFGAILQFSPQHDGMIHISEIAKKRVENVEEYFKMGDKVKAKIVKIDKDAGRIGLSTKEFN